MPAKLEGISGYVERALRVIMAAKAGKIKCGDALDTLWELIINLDYELRRRGVECEAYLN
ncbi:hypothetical protein [Vulcanisaeta thermophila]|uniref:hypothetical protein n=1 Tax=Vulcanisaeta thermophila TaxID=867917 RepID=UPI00085377DF|nr:hypothetical protein [Vulcanisaeta thermophila]